MGHDGPVSKAGDGQPNEEQLARLIGNIVDNEHWPGDRVITLGEEQQVVARPRSRLPIWLGAGAVAIAGAAAMVLTTRPDPVRQQPAAQSLLVPSRAPKPSPTATATATPRRSPPPSAYFAEVRPRRPAARPLRRERVMYDDVEPAPPPRPSYRAYNPYYAEPLDDEQLGEVLVEDHRRTRELNRQQLESLRRYERSSRYPDD